jgi:hypothetical protein
MIVGSNSSHAIKWASEWNKLPDFARGFLRGFQMVDIPFGDIATGSRLPVLWSVPSLFDKTVVRVHPKATSLVNLLH